MVPAIILDHSLDPFQGHVKPRLCQRLPLNGLQPWLRDILLRDPRGAARLQRGEDEEEVPEDLELDDRRVRRRKVFADFYALLELSGLEVYACA